MDILENIKGKDAAKAEMENQYEKLCATTTTQDRQFHFMIMKRLYDKYVCVRQLWDYVETAIWYVKKFVRKIIEVVTDTAPHDYFYIMRFKDFVHGKFCFYKIGSSIHPDKRVKEHEGKYELKGEILYTLDTGDMAASSLEDKVRSYFIRKYGVENYLAKDRFICEIDLEDIKVKAPICLNALRAAEIY